MLSATICKHVIPLKNINELYSVCSLNDHGRKMASYKVLLILSPVQP